MGTTTSNIFMEKNKGIGFKEELMTRVLDLSLADLTGLIPQSIKKIGFWISFKLSNNDKNNGKGNPIIIDKYSNVEQPAPQRLIDLFASKSEDIENHKKLISSLSNLLNPFIYKQNKEGVKVFSTTEEAKSTVENLLISSKLLSDKKLYIINGAFLLGNDVGNMGDTRELNISLRSSINKMIAGKIIQDFNFVDHEIRSYLQKKHLVRLEPYIYNSKISKIENMKSIFPYYAKFVKDDILLKDNALNLFYKFLQKKYFLKPYQYDEKLTRKEQVSNIIDFYSQEFKNNFKINLPIVYEKSLIPSGHVLIMQSGNFLNLSNFFKGLFPTPRVIQNLQNRNKVESKQFNILRNIELTSVGVPVAYSFSGTKIDLDTLKDGKYKIDSNENGAPSFLIKKEGYIYLLSSEGKGHNPYGKAVFSVSDPFIGKYMLNGISLKTHADFVRSVNKYKQSLISIRSKENDLSNYLTSDFGMSLDLRGV